MKHVKSVLLKPLSPQIYNKKAKGKKEKKKHEFSDTDKTMRSRLLKY